MKLKRLMKYLVWTRRVVLILISFSLLVSFLVASIFWMMSGVDPVEGDTYSTPGSNVAGTIIIFGMIIYGWARSKHKKESEDSKVHLTGKNPPSANCETAIMPDRTIPD
jgi:hypothetical protein